jgi:hypothetical protein
MKFILENKMIKRFKQTQKFRLCIGPVSFYATAKQIRSGVGDFSKCNAAVQKSLDALEGMRSGTDVAGQCTVGLAGTWEDISVQINVS